MSEESISNAFGANTCIHMFGFEYLKGAYTKCSGLSVCCGLLDYWLLCAALILWMWKLNLNVDGHRNSISGVTKSNWFTSEAQKRRQWFWNCTQNWGKCLKPKHISRNGSYFKFNFFIFTPTNQAHIYILVNRLKIRQACPIIVRTQA